MADPTIKLRVSEWRFVCVSAHNHAYLLRGLPVLHVCREDMTCASCSHTTRDSSNGLVKPITAPLSHCVWKYDLIFGARRGILQTRDPNVVYRGTYEGTCYLRGDKNAGCVFPNTCEDTILTVKGVIYNALQAVRVGPADNSGCCETSRLANDNCPSIRPSRSTQRDSTVKEAPKTGAIGQECLCLCSWCACRTHNKYCHAQMLPCCIAYTYMPTHQRPCQLPGSTSG
jgi:hypothetical protein